MQADLAPVRPGAMARSDRLVALDAQPSVIPQFAFRLPRSLFTTPLVDVAEVGRDCARSETFADEDTHEGYSRLDSIL